MDTAAVSRDEGSSNGGGSSPTHRLSRRASSTNWVSPKDIKAMSKQHRYDSPFDVSLAAARKRSQQEKLWEIYATYALKLSCEDPTRMRISNVIKLLQDCNIIDGNDTEEAKMIEKEVSIVCESFLKTHPGDRDGTKKLNFTAFIALLVHFAKMVQCSTLSALPLALSRGLMALLHSRLAIRIQAERTTRLCARASRNSRNHGAPLRKNPQGLDLQLSVLTAHRVRVAIAKEFQECKKLLTTFEDPFSKVVNAHSFVMCEAPDSPPRLALADVRILCRAEPLEAGEDRPYNGQTVSAAHGLR